MSTGRNTEHYGTCYWCIGLSEKMPGASKALNEVYVMGERLEVHPSGTLVVLGHQDQLLLAFAPGQWRFCYAASCLDGSAVAWPASASMSRRWRSTPMAWK
jgi:hypothetical protein